jgi:hypothetical protein
MHYVGLEKCMVGSNEKWGANCGSGAVILGFFVRYFAFFYPGLGFVKVTLQRDSKRI